MGFAGMVRRRLLQLAGAGLALWLAACGGGEGGTVGGGGSAGPGAPPGAITLEQRRLATDRLAERLEQLTGGGRATPEIWEQLRQWVLQQPEFEDAGLGNDSLWARFTDGRYFLFTDNWQVPPGTPAASAVAPPQQAVKAALPPAVPASVEALLLGFNDRDFAGSGEAMASMARALQNRGWNVADPQTLTIDALKAGVSKQLGFLFITSHSGLFGPTSQKQFAVMTVDEVSDLNELAYSAELDDGTLIWHRARSFRQELQFKSPRYAFTAKFVERYMAFSPESLVILVACESGTYDADKFRAALFAQGAGTIVGWDGSSNALAFHPMALMVDRLAGANEVDPVTPPNRPRTLNEVWSWLDEKDLLVTPSVEPGFPNAFVRRFGSGFQLLNPIVSELQAGGGDKLVIHGEFGLAPATVTVGGRELPTAYSPDGKWLSVQLSPTDHGAVLVTSRERRSNARQLGSWRGQVRYTQAKEGCEGVLLRDMVTIDLHLRADAHGVRDVIDGPVRNSRLAAIPASDTEASWQSSGECWSHGDLDVRWSGSGAFPIVTSEAAIPATGPFLGNVLLARIDVREQRFQLMNVFGQQAHKTVTRGNDSTTEPLYFDPSLLQFWNDSGDLSSLLPHGTFLPFGANRNVRAAQFRKADPDRPEVSLAVQWDAMPMAPAIDETVGR